MEERQKRPRLSVTRLEGDADEINIDQLNHADKAKLKQMNVKTQIKNVDRLRQLLKDYIYGAQ